MKVAASPQKKEANPASLRSAAPSKGRGSRGHSLLPIEGDAPKGRRLDGGSGMKESEKMHLKSTINESTRAPLRGPPSPMGKAAIRGCRFSRIVKANIGYVEKKNNDGQSLPRVGKVASGSSRIGFWRDEKERGRSSQVRRLREHPLHKQLIKPIYSYKKRKSNAANDFNVIDRSGYRYMREKSEAVHFYD